MKPLLGLCLLLGSAATTSYASDCAEKIDYWPFETTTGNEQVEVLFFADLHLERDCNNARAEVRAGAVAEFRGISIEAVDATAGASLVDYRSFLIDTEINVLGMVVQEYDSQEAAELVYADRVSFPIQVEDSEVFMVGPVPVDIRYGIIGDAGLSYSAAIQVGAVEVDADPYVDSSVYASGGIDAMLAEVRAEGDLTLIKDDFDADFRMMLDLASLDSFRFEATADNQFNALDGRVTVLAESRVPGLSRTYEQDLLSWDGYDRYDQAFDVAVDLPIPTR